MRQMFSFLLDFVPLYSHLPPLQLIDYLQPHELGEVYWFSHLQEGKVARLTLDLELLHLFIELLFTIFLGLLIQGVVVPRQLFPFLDIGLVLWTDEEPNDSNGASRACAYTYNDVIQLYDRPCSRNHGHICQKGM